MTERTRAYAASTASTRSRCAAGMASTISRGANREVQWATGVLLMGVVGFVALTGREPGSAISFRGPYEAANPVLDSWPSRGREPRRASTVSWPLRGREPGGVMGEGRVAHGTGRQRYAKRLHAVTRRNGFRTIGADQWFPLRTRFSTARGSNSFFCVEYTEIIGFRFFLLGPMDSAGEKQVGVAALQPKRDGRVLPRGEEKRLGIVPLVSRPKASAAGR